MFPAELTILSKKLKLVETPNQFRKENGNRRMGLEYWVGVELDSPQSAENSPLKGGAQRAGGVKVGILIQYHITAHTDPTWLKALIQDKRVYITSADHLITMAVAKTLKSEES